MAIASGASPATCSLRLAAFDGTLGCRQAVPRSTHSHSPPAWRSAPAWRGCRTLPTHVMQRCMQRTERRQLKQLVMALSDLAPNVFERNRGSVFLLVAEPPLTRLSGTSLIVCAMDGGAPRLHNGDWLDEDVPCKVSMHGARGETSSILLGNSP
ncbi:hypothetical protein HD554DRAFT_1146387 [Boletus coccyginus]|nr:hypothetical protein HD554DRAFT_1146387 [Boletus coccyginus]